MLVFCLKKDQFWFLLMLRTSLAEVWSCLPTDGPTDGPKTILLELLRAAKNGNTDYNSFLCYVDVQEQPVVD